MGRTYKLGMDTQLEIKNLEMLKLELPDPFSNTPRTEIKIWEKTAWTTM
jgi:hypothetical protein